MRTHAFFVFVANAIVYVLSRVFRGHWSMF
jgi:thiosulfate reductase cytochrome b subunit